MERLINVVLVIGLGLTLSCSAMQYHYYGMVVGPEATGVVLSGPTPKDDKPLVECAPIGKCVVLEEAEYFKILNDLDEAIAAAKLCK